MADDHISNRIAVPLGIKKRVWTSWALTPECQVVRGFNVQIVRTPHHGVATLAKVNQVIDQKWLTHVISAERLAIVHRCMGKPVTTIGVFYTGEALGDDNFRLVITNAAHTRQGAVEINLVVE